MSTLPTVVEGWHFILTELFEFSGDVDLKLKRAQSLVGSSPGRLTHDFYPTPPDATEALLSVETFDGDILEPACGDGAIAKVLAHRYDVISTDLVDRGFGETSYDFLDQDYPYRAANIVTNPPFVLAEKFVETSLQRTTGKVAMLCKLQFLEGAKRKIMFESTPLKTVWVFSKRLTMARNGEREKYSSGMLCFAWFIWEHGYTGKPIIGWL